MLKTCASLLMGLLLIVLPASAELSVDDILVVKQGQDRQLKMYVSNPGPHHTGPLLIHLYTRTAPNGPWRMLEAWKDIKDLEPGEKRILEVSDTEGQARLRAEMAQPGFEMKGVAESAATGQVEKVVTLGADKIDVTTKGVGF